MFYDELIFIYSVNAAALIKDVNHDQCNFSSVIVGMSSSSLSAKVDSSDSIRRSEFLFVLVLLPVIVLECQFKRQSEYELNMCKVRSLF